jgi:hypothetical protein
MKITVAGLVIDFNPDEKNFTEHNDDSPGAACCAGHAGLLRASRH